MPLLFSPEALQPYTEQIAQAPIKPKLAATYQPNKIGIAPYAALIAGNAIDSISSWDTIKSGRGMEGNPLLPNSGPAITGIKAAITVPQALIMRALVKAGHPNVAKVFGYGIGGVGALAGLNNYKVGR
jgi:hypothetical protein